MEPSPPKYALKFLRWFCRDDFIEEIEGNLIEVFEKQYADSPGKAGKQFTWNVIKHFRPAFMKSFNDDLSVTTMNIGMLKNYFKIG